MTASTQEKNQSGQSSVNSQRFFLQRKWLISTLFPKTNVNTCVRFFFYFGNNVFWIRTLQSHCSVQIINNCNRCFQLFGHTRTHLHTARYIAFAFRLCPRSWVKTPVHVLKAALTPSIMLHLTLSLCLISCGKRDFISLPRKTRYCGLYRIPCKCCKVYTLGKQKDLRAEEDMRLRTETSARIPDSHNPCALEWG